MNSYLGKAAVSTLTLRVLNCKKFSGSLSSGRYLCKMLNINALHTSFVPAGITWGKPTRKLSQVSKKMRAERPLDSRNQSGKVRSARARPEGESQGKTPRLVVCGTRFSPGSSPLAPDVTLQ